MKIAKILAAAALTIAISAGASAQGVFTNTGHSSFGRGHRSISDTYFSTVHVSYDHFKESYDVADHGLDGFGFGVSRAFLAGFSVPFYLELGLEGQLYGHSYEGYKANFFALNVPVNILYRIDLMGSGLSLIPYAGFDAMLNITGKASEKKSNAYYNLLSKENPYGIAYRRGMFGAHLGFRVALNNLYFGFQYETYLSKFEKLTESRLAETDFTIGIMF